MRALCVDPGMSMGYCVMEQGKYLDVISYGLLKPEKGGSSGHRVNDLRRQMLDTFYRDWDVLVIENVNVVFGSSFRNEYSFLLQWTYAELLALADERDKPIYQYVPATIKKQFTGNGRAKKPEIVAVCNEALGIELNHNIADAVAIGVTHFRKTVDENIWLKSHVA